MIRLDGGALGAQCSRSDLCKYLGFSCLYERQLFKERSNVGPLPYNLNLLKLA